MRLMFPMLLMRTAIVIPIAAIFIGQTQPAKPTPTKDQADEISRQLNTKDPAEIDAAVIQLRAWAPTGRAPSTEMTKQWIPALLKEGRFQDVSDITLAMVLVGPSTSNIRDLLQFRIIALLSLKRNEEALQMAKSAFNACDQKTVDKIIPLISRALTLCHPDDPGLGRRFSAEQALASSATPSNSPTTRASEPILKSIKIDQALYTQALEDWSKKGTDNARNKEMYANVLLLADQGEKAEKLFREIGESPRLSSQDNTRFKDGVYRALKAQDGNLTRANAWLIQQAATQPKDTALP